MFQHEKLLLSLKASCISCKASIRAYYSMAWDYYRNRIVANSRADCTRRCPRAISFSCDDVCDLSVCHGIAIRDSLHDAADFLLERSPIYCYGNCEIRLIAREVDIEPFRGKFHDRSLPFLVLIGKRFRIIALTFEPEASQGIIIRGQENDSQGRIVIACIFHQMNIIAQEVTASAINIETIIGSLKYDEMNADATPRSPAYHSEPKSVRARGKIRAPRAETGRSIMHLRINFGRRERYDDAK